MRCSICDWTADSRSSSEFSGGIARRFKGYNFNKVVVVNGTPLCGECRDQVKEALREFDE